MKDITNIFKVFLFIAASIALLFIIIAFEGIQAEEHRIDDDSFAVVELFTSEGCSSCPPADRLLGDLVDKARKQDQRIFALAFHVDYWNYLGWEDIYSDAAYSDRQRNYAEVLKTNRIYTPQMIVNGRVQFVGSDRSQAKKSIERALRKSAHTRIDLNPKIDNQHQSVNVTYTLSPIPTNSLINFALVERNITREIKRGENRGLTLHHDNVVRAFLKSGINKTTGNITLDIPQDMELVNASVVVYVQDRTDMDILGAEAVDLRRAVN